MPTAIERFALALAFAFALPAAAQHHHHGDGTKAASPYAGQRSRDIKALSESEIKDLLEGAGMGFAKAAELNRYPGPSHALEHASALGLSAEQRRALEHLLGQHKAAARKLGRDVVELERELDGLFARRAASAEAIDALLEKLARAHARLRGEHLKTHLDTTALLTADQVERYVRVRGYASASANAHRH